MAEAETITNFAKTVYKIGKSDRDNIIGVAGFTGEGKSVFLIHLMREYSKIAKVKWNLQGNLTWSREELLKWIDGDQKGKGKKAEYSALQPDELISMFYRRGWYEDPQKEAIELLNKCRDRHLLIGGGIPNFWDLDTGFQSRIRFYVYTPRGRGKAYVFEQEDNPFASDKWNARENLKLFRKHKSPYKCPNFVCEIHFPDLSPKEKREYYAIRNKKRVNTELQSKKERFEKYSRIKKQRDILLREFSRLHPDLKPKDLADLLEYNLSVSAIRMILLGER